MKRGRCWELGWSRWPLKSNGFHDIYFGVENVQLSIKWHNWWVRKTYLVESRARGEISCKIELPSSYLIFGIVVKHQVRARLHFRFQLYLRGSLEWHEHILSAYCTDLAMRIPAKGGYSFFWFLDLKHSLYWGTFPTPEPWITQRLPILRSPRKQTNPHAVTLK